MKKYLSSLTSHLSPRKGFTLIELLVVIAIIGILSSFLLANFIGVRQRARDGVRKSDLRQIQSALELYRSDIGSYPSSVPNSTNGSCLSSLLSDPVNCSSTVYMKKVPVDPSTVTAYAYSFGVGNTTYSLIACLENDKDPQLDNFPTPTHTNCNSTTWRYTLQNP